MVLECHAVMLLSVGHHWDLLYCHVFGSTTTMFLCHPECFDVGGRTL